MSQDSVSWNNKAQAHAADCLVHDTYSAQLVETYLLVMFHYSTSFRHPYWIKFAFTVAYGGLLLLVTRCALFVTSPYGVIFPFPNQRFGDVCWHNMHTIQHALSLIGCTILCVIILNVSYQRSKLGYRSKIHSVLRPRSAPLHKYQAAHCVYNKMRCRQFQAARSRFNFATWKVWRFQIYC